MAAPADIDFFNILFQAIKKFHEEHAPTILWVPIVWKEHTYYIHKKPTLTLLRLLIPELRRPELQDDNALVEHLYQKQLEGDMSLKRLTLPSDEKILTDQAVQDFHALADQPPQVQEEGFVKLVEDQTGEKKQDERERLLKIEVNNADIPEQTPIQQPTQKTPSVVDRGKSLAEGYIQQKALSRLPQLGRGVARASGSVIQKLGGLTLRAGARGVAMLAAAGGGGLMAGVGIAFIIAFVAIIGVFMLPVLLPDFAKSINALGFPGESIAEATPITPISSGPINSCKFTRASNPQPLQSSILAGWISSAAAKAGIPATVLASVSMHEAQTFTSGAKDTDDSIKTNNYCNYGKKFCELKGSVLHSKAYDKPPQDNPCTPEEIAKGAKTAQAVGLMQLLDIYNSDKGNLCSITNNLEIAATKLKADGVSSNPTQEQIKSAIEKYHGSCNYNGFDYCAEVWKDMQACQISPAPVYNPGGGSNVFSCPVNGGHQTTGSSTVGGHCSFSYPFQCIKPGQTGYTGRETAVDIQGSDRNVFLPNLGGGSVEWTIDEVCKKDNNCVIADSEGGGIAVGARGSLGGRSYRIRLVHIESSTLNVGDKASSGKLVGKYNGNANHTHVTLQEDGSYKPADLYFKLCQ